MPQEYTKLDCIRALQQAAKQVAPETLTRRRYRDLLALPSNQTITTYFNSWNAAMMAAGLKNPFIVGAQRTTDAQILEIIRQFFNEHGADRTGERFYYRNRTPDMPALSTVIRRFGSWKNALGLVYGIPSWTTEEEQVYMSALDDIAAAANETIKHTNEALTSWTSLGQQLAKLKLASSSEAMNQYRQVGIGLTKTIADNKKTTAAVQVLKQTPTPTTNPTPVVLPRLTADNVRGIRSTNWSCFEDGRTHQPPSAAYLKRVRAIRLPITWDYDKTEIDGVLNVADSVPGAVVFVECHSYGRVGNARNSNGVTTGPLATAQQIADHSVRIYNDFKAHPSFVLMLDNEPMQAPHDWEVATQTAVDALAAVGYKGVLVIPLSQASNVGSGPSNHPNPWIKAPVGIDVVYNGHHYPEGQREAQGVTVAELDSYARGRGFNTYTDYIRNWFNWGLLGSPAWSSTRILIGETHFVIPEHLALYLSLAKVRGIAVFLWADGVWNPNYGYLVDEQQLQILDTARA